MIQIGFGDLDDEGIQKIIDIFDENGDGEMDFLEFIEFFSYVCKNLVKKNPKAKYLKYANVSTKKYYSTSYFHHKANFFNIPRSFGTNLTPSKINQPGPARNMKSLSSSKMSLFSTHTREIN